MLKLYTKRSLTQEMRDAGIQSRDSILRWYLERDASKTQALGFLLDRIYRNDFKSLVSFGAGPSVLEYLLACALPASVKVIATDYERLFVEQASAFFHPILARSFDLFRDDPEELTRELGYVFDLAVFFGSSYVMSNEQFINFYRRLQMIGVKEVIDFQAGFITYAKLPGSILNTFCRRIMARASNVERGRFHGYARTRKELRNIYNQAGWHLTLEARVPPYQYVSVCRVQKTTIN